MVLRLVDQLREFLSTCQGNVVDLKYLRSELKVDPNSPAWNSIRSTMLLLVKEKIVKPSGRNDGTYKVIKQVRPIRVFNEARERRQPFDLRFPRDYDSGMEFEFAEHIVVREGDLILIAGQSNYGKTGLAINFLGENVDTGPVIMGNEYTTIDDEPTPRFLNRLDNMDWVEWVDGDGSDKFTLLPVREDYAEHIVKDQINIVDWINLDEHYMISRVMEDVKRAIGRGVGIIVIQKSEGTTAGRGGQFTKDFADCEILIDRFSELESLLTIGKVKEYTKPVTGKTYAFGIGKGVKIINFREVKRCPSCHGQGYNKSGKCDDCYGNKYVNA